MSVNFASRKVKDTVKQLILLRVMNILRGPHRDSMESLLLSLFPIRSARMAANRMQQLITSMVVETLVKASLSALRVASDCGICIRRVVTIVVISGFNRNVVITYMKLLGIQLIVLAHGQLT